MNRSEAEANRLLSEKISPSWQRPAPCRTKAKKPATPVVDKTTPRRQSLAELPQWLLNYLWRK